MMDIGELFRQMHMAGITGATLDVRASAAIRKYCEAMLFAGKVLTTGKLFGVSFSLSDPCRHDGAYCHSCGEALHGK